MVTRKFSLIFISIAKLSLGGKCSICGEAYDLKPQLLGVGDAMYLGKIVRTYTQGATIPVTVIVSFEIVPNYQGAFLLF